MANFFAKFGVRMIGQVCPQHGNVGKKLERLG